MKTTAGRLRNLSLATMPAAEVVFVLPDGTFAEIETAETHSVRVRNPKTRGPMYTETPALFVKLKRSDPATVPA